MGIPACVLKQIKLEPVLEHVDVDWRGTETFWRAYVLYRMWKEASKAGQIR